MSLINNIIGNFRFLQQDFIGLTFNFDIFVNLFINLAIPVVLMGTLYLIGQKIRLFLFKKNNGSIDFFIEIAFGYIFLATGILILGMTGFLYRNVLYSLFVIVFAIAIFPLNTLKKRLNVVFKLFAEYRKQFTKYKLANIAILAFILISFLRLIPPEIGVDALWYHTDYPKNYLKNHTMMNIDPKGKYYPAVTPTLSDMFYVLTESINVKDSARFIHFGFYFLVIFELLIIFRKRFSFIPYAVLLFVTSPIIIRVSSSAYAEFPWIFCWLLAVFLITNKNKHTFNDLIIPAVLFGGTLATKLWMLPFFGVLFAYILIVNFSDKKLNLLKLLASFTILTFSIPSLWYLRAFIITANPLFPTFWNYSDGSVNSPVNFLLNIEGLKTRILSIKNVSPLSIIGVIFILPLIKHLTLINFKKHKFVLFVSILTITQFVINYSFHRFVIPFYSIFVIALAFGIDKFVNFNKIFKYIFYLLFCLLFIYYFINTLLILPYGLGWANQNRYLSRILSENNSSYYDYNYQFSKFISDKDLVASYGLWGFYYGNFNYIYAEDVFKKRQKSLSELSKLGSTKLLILGGDINWLCKIEDLKDCSSDRYKLLTSYKFPKTASSQYLYELNNYGK